MNTNESYKLEINNCTNTTVVINGDVLPPDKYKIDGKTLTLAARSSGKSETLKRMFEGTRWKPGTCPSCMRKDIELVHWGDKLVCNMCGFTDDNYRWEEPTNPLLEEEDILALGWKITPDTTLWTSYIISDGDGTYYELSNEDKDSIWTIQECDEEGNYVQEGENMFFILKNRKDLKDLMRLMGLK